MNKTVIVLDTSAFIAGFDPPSISHEQYSVPTVKDELIPSSLPWVRFNMAVESGKLKVIVPNVDFLNKVKESSKSVGDALSLSTVDLQVLALAIELKSTGHEPLIVTDDYSIQNVANKMGMKFVSLMTFGIRYRLHWIAYCPACHRKYPPNCQFKFCKICGTKLKRKPLRKIPVTKQT